MKKTTKILSCMLLVILCICTLTACLSSSAVAGNYSITGLLIDGTEQNIDDYAEISLILDENGDYTLSFDKAGVLAKGEWTIAGRTINFSAAENENSFTPSLIMAINASAAISIIGGADGPTSVFINEGLQKAASKCTFKNNILTVKIAGYDTPIVLLFSKKV